MLGTGKNGYWILFGKMSGTLFSDSTKRKNPIKNEPKKQERHGHLEFMCITCLRM